jgi:amidase
MGDVDLCYLSASDALRLFRSCALSPVELLDALLDRSAAVEPEINAFSNRYIEGSLLDARLAESRYMGKGAAPRPLEGIPTAIKEEEPVAGEPWTQGSLIHALRIADATSAFAQRILDAGAILHARTTTPEFCCAGFTHSRLWGVTRNPWNPAFSAGGSSGGSAAALAAGTTTLATGSDIAGSIRIPAAFNGIVGFKPPFGRVPQMAPFNLDAYAHCGPLARTVQDCLLFENVLAGPDPFDHVSLHPKLELPMQIPGISGLRIALSADLGDWPLDPEIRRNTVSLALALRDQGAIVEEVDLHVPRARVLRAMDIHFRLGFASWLDTLCKAHPDLVTDYAADFGQRGFTGTGHGTQWDAFDIAATLYPPIATVLTRYDALICAANGTRGLAAGDSYVGHGLEVDGHLLENYLEAILTPVFNLFSRCPVLSVPSGFADNGIPTGIQIVGRPYDDLTPFRIGAACERARPWFDTAARRPPHRRLVA